MDSLDEDYGSGSWREASCLADARCLVGERGGPVGTQTGPAGIGQASWAERAGPKTAPAQRYARGAVVNPRVSADRGSSRMSRTVLANASRANGFGETACRCAEFRAAACFVGVARVVQHLQLRIVSPRRAGDGVGRAAANEHSSPENAIIAGCAATCSERTASNGGSVQEIQENRRGSIDHVSGRTHGWSAGLSPTDQTLLIDVTISCSAWFESATR